MEAINSIKNIFNNYKDKEEKNEVYLVKHIKKKTKMKHKQKIIEKII